MLSDGELKRFESNIFPEPNTGCWLWYPGTITDRGYGTFWLAGKHRSAHRLAYEHYVGPIPPDKQLDHLCRQRSCVNPSHLEPVTPKENSRRSPLVCRRMGKSTCKYGHPMTPDNVSVFKGYPSCLTCMRKRAVEHVLRRRAALALLVSP